MMERNVWILINAVTFLTFAWDKLCAVNQRHRISTKTLLTLSAMGGAFGGLLSMYTFRHKTKTKKFTIGLSLMLLVQGTLWYYRLK